MMDTKTLLLEIEQCIAGNPDQEEAPAEHKIVQSSLNQANSTIEFLFADGSLFKVTVRRMERV